MRLVARTKDEQNLAAVDPWTVVHFASGLALGLIGSRRETALGLAVGYEIVEQFVERQRWGQDFFDTRRPESGVNAVVDVLVLVAGHALGRAWNETGSR